MDYYVRSQLPVLALEEECEALDRNTIRDLLMKKPFNLVFIEVKGKLFGIITIYYVAILFLTYSFTKQAILSYCKNNRLLASQTYSSL